MTEDVSRASPRASEQSDSALSPFDSAQFRKVLGHFPTGVTIVTGWAGDVPAGFTIGSFTSVSLDPPLVGFLPMVSSDTWQAMAPASKFCVNVLRDDQADLCWRFAKSGVGDDRFDEVVWTTSPTGLPDPRGRRGVDRLHASSTSSSSATTTWSSAGSSTSTTTPTRTRPLVFYKGALGGFLAAD